jgi:hypothetical protein
MSHLIPSHRHFDVVQHSALQVALLGLRAENFIAMELEMSAMIIRNTGEVQKSNSSLQLVFALEYPLHKLNSQKQS